MYRCFHCRDLHISSEQARVCAESEGDWFAEALVEVDRILARGPISSLFEEEKRETAPPTLPERRLWEALGEALPDEIRSQWWIPGCDHRVDCFIPFASLAIEVDDDSPPGRAGGDRLRSSVLRSHGVTIIRIPNDLAMTAPERVAAVIADRAYADVRVVPEAIPA